MAGGARQAASSSFKYRAVCGVPALNQSLSGLAPTAAAPTAAAPTAAARSDNSSGYSGGIAVATVVAGGHDQRSRVRPLPTCEAMKKLTPNSWLQAAAGFQGVGKHRVSRQISRE